MLKYREKKRVCVALFVGGTPYIRIKESKIKRKILCEKFNLRVGRPIHNKLGIRNYINEK
jgi:hypothetical protein